MIIQTIPSVNAISFTIIMSRLDKANMYTEGYLPEKSASRVEYFKHHKLPFLLQSPTTLQPIKTSCFARFLPPAAVGIRHPAQRLGLPRAGSGKSDLALRLIDGYADCRLVSDDRTDLVVREGLLYASAPARIAGLLELRGVGIVTLPFQTEAALALLIDLVPRDAVPRLPVEDGSNQADQSITLAGLTLPGLALNAFDASTPAKIRLALSQHRASTISAKNRDTAIAPADELV